MAGSMSIGAALIAVSTAVANTGLPVASNVLPPAHCPTSASFWNGYATSSAACLPISPRGWYVSLSATA